jgi:sterol desaturase/sphingolipid hydroxylase (fatty acid hydroxylase superfamily)
LMNGMIRAILLPLYSLLNHRNLLSKLFFQYHHKTEAVRRFISLPVHPFIHVKIGIGHCFPLAVPKSLICPPQ